MKKTIYYISMLLVWSLVYGCTTQVDEVFDQSASERLEGNAQECLELLTSASNGWVIEYYPEDEQSYGGYVYLAKFDENGDVTVSGEIGETDETVTSHYSILQSNSVILSFDTYNELFHYFSDPDQNSGESMGGDFEFTYVSGTSDEIIFTGTKTGNTYKFTALSEEVVWSEYLEGVLEMEETINGSPYIGFTYDGIEYDLDGTYRIISYVPDSLNPDTYEYVAFCCTPTGISLYKSIDIDGTSTQNLVWDSSTEEFTTSDGQIVLSGVVSDDYVSYDTYLGSWTFSYYNGRYSRTATISENVRGVSYTLTISGLSYPITLGYSKVTGNLSMTTQCVGTSGSYYVFLCPWDCDLGYLTWSSSAGMDLVYNRDEENPTLTFEDNGGWSGYNVNGLLFYTFSSASPSSSTRVSNIAQYAYVVSLHK